MNPKAEPTTVEDSHPASGNMGPPSHAPENRRQALKDRKPLLPDSALNPLDADIETQLEAFYDDGTDGDTDVLAMQAKAGIAVN